MKFLYFITLFTFLLTVSTAARTETKCDIIAFVTDPASVVSVRSGAGPEFGIVKTVPKDRGRTVFSVSASKGDWVKVTRAENSQKEPQTVFSGTGWVFAAELAVTEMRDHYRIFEAATKRSKVIDIALYNHVLPLAGCHGRWIKVHLPITGTGVSTKTKTGWLPDGLWCGNPAYECES